MLEITFKEFYELSYEGDAWHELYVVKNGLDEVLYVGITSQKIWDRWFGWNGHISLSGAILVGKSSVGCKIVYLEPFMIEKLRPTLNVMYNLNPGADNTPKSEKEKAREAELDRIYKEVFEKNSKWK